MIGRHHEGQVQGSASKLVQKVTGPRFAQMKVYSRVVLVKGSKDFGHHADAQRWGSAKPNPPLVQPCQLLHLVSHGFCVREHPLGQRKERFSGCGECDVAPGAVEKLGTEIVFKCRNLSAQRGLGQMQMLCRAREMADPGNFNKTLQLFEVHVP